MLLKKKCLYGKQIAKHMPKKIVVILLKEPFHFKRCPPNHRTDIVRQSWHVWAVELQLCHYSKSLQPTQTVCEQHKTSAQSDEHTH